MGETYTTNSNKPAQSKVKAINEMPAPTCKKQVQSFIGMIHYLSKFSARLSELAEPIRRLCKDKVPFNWGSEHQDAFKLVKIEIVTTPILAYYNPRNQTVLQTDTSIKGLGACLLQDQNPFYFASKVVTEAQRGYVAIAVEYLAVAWAMEKFHHFLMQATSFLKQTKSHWRQYCLKVLTKQLQDWSTYNKNIPIPLHGRIHTRTHQPTCRLLVHVRQSKRYH